MKTIAVTIKFLLVLIIATIGWSVVWQYTLTGHVYDCTDEVGFDYLSPGDWVHGSIEYVDTIDTARVMELPDTLKRGWTIHHLWGIWLTMSALSVGAALLLSKVSWAGLTSPAEKARRAAW